MSRHYKFNSPVVDKNDIFRGELELTRRLCDCWSSNDKESLTPVESGRAPACPAFGDQNYISHVLEQISLQ